MGMIIGRDTAVRTITLRNRDGSAAGTISVSKSNKNQNKKKLKRLSYNFKGMSAVILRAKTSGSARQAVTKTRVATAMLRKKLRCGEYDDEELKMAIIHAEQMVKIAKKRMKHLQEEERLKKGGFCEAEMEEYEDSDLEYPELTGDEEIDVEELKRLMEEMQQLQEEMTESEDFGGLEELSEVLRADMDPEDLELLKKKHRADELREIAEADMKYLKAFFNKLEKEKQAAMSSSGGNGSGDSSGNYDGGGVSLELAGMAQPMSVSDVPAPVSGGSLDVTI